MKKTLKQMRTGESGLVESLSSTGALRRRMIDMGITPGVEVTMRKTAPLGDPVQIHLRGYELSIRKSEAEQIVVETLDAQRD